MSDYFVYGIDAAKANVFERQMEMRAKADAEAMRAAVERRMSDHQRHLIDFAGAVAAAATEQGVPTIPLVTEHRRKYELGRQRPRVAVEGWVVAQTSGLAYPQGRGEPTDEVHIDTVLASNGRMGRFTTYSEPAEAYEPGIHIRYDFKDSRPVDLDDKLALIHPRQVKELLSPEATVAIEGELLQFAAHHDLVIQRGVTD